MARRRVPSDRYLMALRRDLERLERGVRYHSNAIRLCERDLERYANNPELVADSLKCLNASKQHRADFQDKYNFRAFQMMLFSPGRFDAYGGITAAIFRNDENRRWCLEVAMRLDPDLLEGDAIFFDGQ